MKVETDIIASITESLSAYAVVMSIEAFKTDVIVFIYFYRHNLIMIIYIFN